MYDMAFSGKYAYSFWADTNPLQVCFRIIDISDPTNPVVVGKTFLDNGYGNYQALAVQGNYAYVMEQSRGLIVVDIGDKANPRVVNRDSSLWYMYIGPSDMAVHGNLLLAMETGPSARPASVPAASLRWT